MHTHFVGGLADLLHKRRSVLWRGRCCNVLGHFLIAHRFIYKKLSAAKMQYPMMIVVAAGEVGSHTKTAVKGTKTVMRAMILKIFSFILKTPLLINVCLSLNVHAAQDVGK